MDRTLLIDGIRVSEKDLYYAKMPPIPTPEQDIEHVEIRGRHGSLTKKYGYKDIPYPIEFYIYEEKPFRKTFRKVKSFLLNAERLSFADDVEVYYRVKSVRIDEADSDVYKFGRFTVEFTLAPFMYEIDNPVQAITDRTVITNDGYKAEPIITAHCSGTGNIYINDDKVTIKDVNGTITIDSEMMNAYRISDGYITNLNNHMIGDFPVLRHGDNVIDFDGDISKIEIIKNWRWV